MLGKIESKRIRRWQRMRWSDSVTNSMDMNLSKIREIVEDRGTWRAAIHGVTKSWLFASGGQSIGVSASVLPMHIQG